VAAQRRIETRGRTRLRRQPELRPASTSTQIADPTQEFIFGLDLILDALEGLRTSPVE
jgi:hypothetical protein